MQGTNFILGFEGDGDGSGKDGARIPHIMMNLKILLFRGRYASVSGRGVSLVKI